MANAKKTFLQWYDENSSFLKKPLASKEWDQQIAEPIHQKAIATSKTARELYKQTENKLVHDYTDMIHWQLRKVYRALKRIDIATPTGFTDRKKSSIDVLNYLNCRELFEKFITEDIQKSNDRSAQLRAFARWVAIAELQLKKHNNYDAYHLVTMHLLVLDGELHLSKDLPKSVKETYEELNTLMCPFGNFKNLRQHMQANPNQNKLGPVSLYSADVLHINDTLGGNQKSSIANIDLGIMAYSKIEALASTHPSYKQLMDSLNPEAPNYKKLVRSLVKSLAKEMIKKVTATRHPDYDRVMAGVKLDAPNYNGLIERLANEQLEREIAQKHPDYAASIADLNATTPAEHAQQVNGVVKELVQDTVEKLNAKASILNRFTKEKMQPKNKLAPHLKDTIEKLYQAHGVEFLQKQIKTPEPKLVARPRRLSVNKLPSVEQAKAQMRGHTRERSKSLNPPVPSFWQKKETKETAEAACQESGQNSMTIAVK